MVEVIVDWPKMTDMWVKMDASMRETVGRKLQKQVQAYIDKELPGAYVTEPDSGGMMTVTCRIADAKKLKKAIEDMVSKF